MSININIYNNNIATRLTKQINEMIKIYEGPRQSSSFETWAPNFIKTREEESEKIRWGRMRLDKMIKF